MVSLEYIYFLNVLMYYEKLPNIDNIYNRVLFENDKESHYSYDMYLCYSFSIYLVLDIIY